MKHKHAEVLIAIAEGREVEFKYGDEWYFSSCGRGKLNPLDNPNYEWRVKKVPVVEVKCFRKYHNSITDEIIFYESTSDLEKWDMKVTFEDGVAVKAEFPKID